MAQLPVIDLFAGAGGLSVGATNAGLNVLACVEIDNIACETLRLNSRYHGKIIEGDVSKLSGHDLRKQAGLKKKEPFILMGGAPCQPFSKASYWTEEGKESRYRRARAAGQNVKKPKAPTKARPDERRDLVAEFWRLIHESNADGFIFENVPSIKHPRNKPIFDAFKQSAIDEGYYVTEVFANAAEYGIAQTRERIFLLGAKRKAPIAPKPTHVLTAVSERSISLKQAITAEEALEGLNHKKYFEPEELVTGRWASHLEEIPPGWNYKALTKWAGHPSPTFVAETRFWNFLLKLAPDRPSWTLAASPGPWTGPFHWDSRRLRCLEMAALQGFPKKYKFSGTRRDKVRQIGNAVPPPIAKMMAESVANAVEK